MFGSDANCSPFGSSKIRFEIKGGNLNPYFRPIKNFGKNRNPGMSQSKNLGIRKTPQTVMVICLISRV